MKTVYLLQHLHKISDDKEDIKIIGIYDSKNKAIEAIEGLKYKPGFKKFPKLINPKTDSEEEGFYIDEYEINKDHWPDGYEAV